MGAEEPGPVIAAMGPDAVPAPDAIAIRWEGLDGQGLSRLDVRDARIGVGGQTSTEVRR